MSPFYTAFIAHSKALASIHCALWVLKNGTKLSRVSVADKLYNARAILAEYKQIGAEVWTRFKRGRKHQLWYFDELIKVFEQRCTTWRIVEELKRTVVEFATLCSSESPLAG